MHLVQILLPLYDDAGAPIARPLFARVAVELTERFGGLTAYTRAPAEGIWKEGPEPTATARDQIVIYEVMTGILDADWWNICRGRLTGA